ncbi:MAG: NFACT family protein [Methanoregulaceae archaeon]|nr:NFACT family protein [Methanoregulaceae archaeon]
MSGIDLRAVTAELAGLLPLWVDKIYQFDGKTLGIRLKGEEHAKYQLIVESGRRTHLVPEFPDPPTLPPAFAMLLRKHLSGGKVLDIWQQGIQRILVIDVGKRDLVYHLVIELFDVGNIVLCEGDFTIIKPLSHHRFKDREVVPGAIYRFSTADPAIWTEDEFSAFLARDDREIVKALAVGAMFGGLYAEYLCRDAGIDKDTPASRVDPVVVYGAVNRLLERAVQERHPVLFRDACLPFPLEVGGSAPGLYPTFNEALSAYYPSRSTAVAKQEKKATALTKEQVIQRQQEQAIEKFARKCQQNERIVEAIYEHYPLVEDVIRTLQDASMRMSWQEIEAVLKANREGPAGKVVAVHPETASVELEVGQRVTIFVHEGVEANIGRYYDQIKKFKKKIAGARAALARSTPKAAPRRPQVPVMKKRWYHRFRWFFTSDRVLVIGGRDAAQNEELVKKYMEGGDTFAHADVHGASVVIVKGTTTRIDEVARFAASYSGAWKSGHFGADVYLVRPEQVSKTPEAGEYVSRGSFIVRGERHYERNVPLGVAIGLSVHPDLAVIGGPPGPVRERSRVWVELKPGQYEPNDTAKKVLRALRDKLPPEDLKGLAAVLNTDAVAAFVPAGGSDIVEAA